MARVDLITPSSGEVLSVATAKAFARVTHAAEDALFAVWVPGCVQFAQEWMRRQLLEATFELVGDGFGELTCCGGDVPRRGRECPIRLFPAPLVAVESVKYVDVDGVDQTLAPADYAVATPAGPTADAGFIYPVSPEPVPEWPETLEHGRDTVRIRFRAGYGTDAAAIPEGIKNALGLALAELYARREASDWRAVLARELRGFRL